VESAPFLLAAVLMASPVGFAAPGTRVSTRLVPFAAGGADLAVPAELSDAEVARLAEASFAEGVRLRRQSDSARPHFRTAARYFDELRRRGASNATLYRNLGNAQVLADELPQAILSYHRGLRLAPQDGELRACLEGARELVVYPSNTPLGRPAPDRRPPWLPRVRSEWLLGGAVLLYALGWVGLTRWLMTRRGRPLALGVVSLLAGIALTGAVIVSVRAEAPGRDHSLVVIAEDGVLLRKGDGLSFPPRYQTPLNRGVEARLLFERGDWLQIELGGGEVGWVPRAYAVVDEP
jgi:hypothetical protein